MSRRAHSPLPPPREPRGPMYDAGRDRGGGGGPPPGGPPPRRRGRDESPPPVWRGERGRGSPPYGPPKRSRRDDEFYDRYDRSPPPPPHRGRYNERDEYYHGGGGGGPRGGYDPYPGQPPPPPREQKGPLPFRQFLNTLTDDVSPEEAQRAYDAYLLDAFGDQAEAEWHKTRKSAAVRERFHPAAFEERLARRRADAAEAAAAFASDLENGHLDAGAEGFNQGAYDLELFASAPPPEAPGGAGERGGGGERPRPPAPPPPPPAPALLWRPERAAADFKAAARLAAVLDAEKGVARNPLLPEVPTPMDADKADEPAAPDAAAAAAAASDGGAAPDGAAAAAAPASAALEARLAAVDAAAPPAPEEGDAEGLDGLLGRLDVLLTWLWRVHGVDYYGGRELLRDDEWGRRLAAARSLRGPRPEEGEELEEGRAKKDAERLASAVDERWAARIRDGDPVLRGCMREEIERRVEKWIDDQIFQQTDSKWGNLISQKFFLEKKFVVKHIKNKQADAVERARAAVRILEVIAKERFLEVRGAELRQQQQERAAARAAAPPRGGDEWGGAGGGGGPPGGEWGGGGGAAGWLAAARHGSGGIPVVDPSMLMGGMGGMGAPVIIPIGGMPPMVGGVPPILPLGGSMLPGGIIPLAGLGGGGDLGGRGGGGRGGRGRGGGRGGGGGAPRGAYFDLDAPSNNRDVLDYSDLL
ncbi:MAG: hypothetical protein J3K34DRAFT_508811 [Monoraphidium minutum]|nr:MAG: hypothetical protein J3K34DRAFT_508811 [Monoraphidium minutum]